MSKTTVYRRIGIKAIPIDATENLNDRPLTSGEIAAIPGGKSRKQKTVRVQRVDGKGPLLPPIRKIKG